MEEKIEIWQVGNTGLRNPNRIQEGFKAFANSPYVGNLRKENEIDFMNFRYSLLFHKSPKGFKNGFITNALTKLITNVGIYITLKYVCIV